MAHGEAREGKWRGNWRMEWVASILHTTSEHGLSSITTADAHTSAASSRLNWRLRRFKWTRPFRRKTKSGFCVCAITFQLAFTNRMTMSHTGVFSLPFIEFRVTHSLGHILSQYISTFRCSYNEKLGMLCILSLINSFMEPFYHSAVKTIFHTAFFHQIPLCFNHCTTQNLEHVTLCSCATCFHVHSSSSRR